MAKTKNGVVALVLVCLCACNNPAGNSAKNADASAYALAARLNWLAGSWKVADTSGTAYEAWTKDNDSTFSARSFFVKGKDTIPLESVQLVQKGNELFYIPIVNGQNGGQPVPFKLTSSVNDQWVFENPAHDFPQKISYAKITNDSLLAFISGPENGRIRTENFPMSRVK